MPGPQLAGHWEEVPGAVWPEHVQMKQARPRGRAVMTGTLSGGRCSPPPQPCPHQPVSRTDRSKMEAHTRPFPPRWPLRLWESMRSLRKREGSKAQWG